MANEVVEKVPTRKETVRIRGTKMVSRFEIVA